MTTDDIDLESRRLCPDGACIGVLDTDSYCAECGRTWHGAAEDSSIPMHAPEPEPEPEEQVLELTPDDARELCPDGACIGLIGPDGICGECRRPRLL